MRTIIFPAIGLLACVNANPSYAQQDPVSTVSNSPDVGMTTIRLVNGKVIVIDGVERKILIPGDNGVNYEIPLSQAALQAASGNQTLANQYQQNVIHFSTNPQNTFTLTSSPTPRLAHIPGGGGGGGGTTDPEAVMPGIGIDSNPIPDLGGPCDLSPCTPYRFGNGNIMYQLDSWSGGIGYGSVSEQTQWANDEKDWERWRGGQCSAAESTYLNFLAATFALSSCLTVETIAGALPCAAAITVWGNTGDQYKAQSSACESTYPGPGNW